MCLLGSIISEDSTAENQSRAIISSFNESSQLLADWIETTKEMYPGREDLVNLIPKPSRTCFSKLLNGMVWTDTTPLDWHGKQSSTTSVASASKRECWIRIEKFWKVSDLTVNGIAWRVFCWIFVKPAPF